MIDNFTNILLDLSMEEEFNRIKDNKDLSSSNIPYTTQYLDMLIKYFEYLEDYEKCQILLSYKKNKIDSHEKKFKAY